MKLKFFVDRYRDQRMDYLVLLPEAVSNTVVCPTSAKRMWLDIDVADDEEVFGPRVEGDLWKTPGVEEK